MLRRYLSLTVAVLTGLTLTTGLAASTFAAGGSTAREPQGNAGPSCPFTTELTLGNAVPLKDAAIINKTHCGYRYRAGQQNSHLKITVVKSGLRFADTRTSRFDHLAASCKKVQHVKRGVVAVCKIPDGYSSYKPLLIEVWPRLGNDYVDGSSLSDMFSMAVLADAGNDVAKLGAGPDYFNGAFGRDRVWGGASNDWLRTGTEADHVWGGQGDDFLVGVDGPDVIDGGEGTDMIYCGPGQDQATVDQYDTRMVLCEKLNHN